MSGEVLDERYRLERSLGLRGQGTLHEARDLQSGLSVAVKVWSPPPRGASDLAVRRFLQGLASARTVDSPHVARVLGGGFDARRGVPYLVTEPLAGEDLQSVLAREGALVPSVAVRIAAQLCLGLRRVHAAGLLHRDVQPANVLLAPGDGDEVTVKLLDLGASWLGLDGVGGASSSPYMAPELARGGREVDARADLWSLGVVLFQALAGRMPHGPMGLGDLLIAIGSQPAPPLGRVAPWVSPDVAAVVATALALERERRFADANALLAALRELEPLFALRPGDVRGLPDAARHGRHAAPVDGTELPSPAVDEPESPVSERPEARDPAFPLSARPLRRGPSPGLVLAVVVFSALLTLGLLLALTR